MLINFTLKNWMSFRDEAEFSMIATKERQHGGRIPHLKKYQTRILPVAAIYGGNASGKTNFFKALNFAKNLIVRGTQPDSLINIEPFRMDKQSVNNPTSFVFELLVNETIYEFSFSLTKKNIIEEKLVQINSSSEKILYHRKGKTPNFHKSLKDTMFLEFAFKGTRDNQLFLTNSVSQKVETFKPVYDWFKNTLELIAPDSRFEPFEQFLNIEHPLYVNMNDLLPKLDTGIAHLGVEEISLDNVMLPESLKSKLQEELKEGATVRLLGDPINERLIISRQDGELKAKRMVTYHPNADGTEAKFDMRLESDGSQRVIDLLPAFLTISEKASKKVYIIDEVDRSLHTLLTRQLIESYLACCSNTSRSQILFTTHDVLLMNQEILRRDEMWVTERDSSGSSKLIPFSDYKDVRYDKDICKSYLQGRLGGTPKLLSKNMFYALNETEKISEVK